MTVIGVCGGSAAGKSSLAEELQKRLGSKTLLLSMDSYYLDIGPITPEERAKINFDEPEAFDLELLARDLDHLKQGQVITCPVYDYHTCHRVGVSDPVQPEDYVIFEGLFLLSREIIRSRLDHSIFVDASEDIRIQRRLERDVRERKRTEEMVLKQLHDTVLPMHNKHIEPFKEEADFLVDNGAPSLDGLRNEVGRFIHLLRNTGAS